MTPLDHLEALARAGYHLEILHHEDRQKNAPTPPRKVFSVDARRVDNDEIHLYRGRAETLTEAIEQASQGATT